MACCFATGPMINPFSSFFFVGLAAREKTGKSETQNLSHRLTLGRNREPLNRRSCRSFRASFIWMVLFFGGDLEPISALDFHKVTKWQTKATSAHRNGQTNEEIAVYSRKIKHRKQWTLVLTWSINGGLCFKKPMRAFNVAIKLCKD